MGSFAVRLWLTWRATVYATVTVISRGSSLTSLWSNIYRNPWQTIRRCLRTRCFIKSEGQSHETVPRDHNVWTEKSRSRIETEVLLFTTSRLTAWSNRLPNFGSYLCYRRMTPIWIWYPWDPMSACMCLIVTKDNLLVNLIACSGYTFTATCVDHSWFCSVLCVLIIISRIVNRFCWYVRVSESGFLWQSALCVRVCVRVCVMVCVHA